MSRLVRVYPRMVVGGTETHVLALLRHFPGPLVVPGVAGRAVDLARAGGSEVTVIERPRFAATVRAVRGARVAHLHTINNDPLLVAALQLAGPTRLVQTVHNHLTSERGGLFDHTWVVGAATAAVQTAPGRVSVLPEGVDVPSELPTRASLDGRPVRVLEVRRDGKEMAYTLDDLAAAGAFAGLAVDAVVVGVEGPTTHGVRRVGVVDDPRAWLEWADVVVHGSAAETFGRTVYEASAAGAAVVVAPLPAFEQLIAEGHVSASADASPAAGASALRARIAALGTDRDAEQRRAAFDRVGATASTHRMIDAQRAGYAAVDAGAPAPRALYADDLDDDALDPLGAALDAAMYARALPAGLPEPAAHVAAVVLTDLGVLHGSTAARALRHALAYLGDRAPLWRSVGGAARDVGDVATARDAYTRAWALDPADVTAPAALLEFHLHRGERAHALAVLERALDAAPGWALGRRLEARLRGSVPPAPG